MLINPNTMPRLKTQPPAVLLPWITHPTSMTEKLRLAAGQAKLQVLRQQWDLPNWWDVHHVKISDKSVMHREILMSADEDACWYARTILPHTTYQSNPLFFDQLQNQSLGKLIFSNPDVKRISLSHYAIDKESIEYHWLNGAMHNNEPVLWVRLSSFTINDCFPFYLVEILLPGLLRATN